MLISVSMWGIVSLENLIYCFKKPLGQWIFSLFNVVSQEVYRKVWQKLHKIVEKVDKFYVLWSFWGLVVKHKIHSRIRNSRIAGHEIRLKSKQLCPLSFESPNPTHDSSSPVKECKFRDWGFWEVFGILFSESNSIFVFNWVEEPKPSDNQAYVQRFQHESLAQSSQERQCSYCLFEVLRSALIIASYDPMMSLMGWASKAILLFWIGAILHAIPSSIWFHCRCSQSLECSSKEKNFHCLWKGLMTFLADSKHSQNQ